MRTLVWRLCALLLICGGTSALAQDLRRSSPASQGLDEVRLERLDAALQSYVDDGRIAGSVTLVLRDGRVVYSAAKGMRNIAARQPMTEDTIFRIASQTKAIISTGIMILHERGDLQITDPLSRYFPEWANTKVAVARNGGGYDLVPLARPITLRDLLTHTSGIGYGGFASTGPADQAWVDAGISGWYFASNDEPIGETVKRMAALPQQAQPGTQWIYGYNVDILGAVIEKASGRDLATFLRTEIFEPLDMDDTQFYVDPDDAERLAVVYQPKAGGGIEPVPAVGSMLGQGEYVNGPRVSYSGGAGLTSTAGDYAKFLQMTLNGGILNGVRLLSPKTVELMVTDHLNGIPFQPGNGMGLGFSVLKDLGARGTMGSVGEYGWGGAYHSQYWVDPVEKLVVVYLTQILNTGVLNDARALDDFSKLRTGIYQSIIESDAEYLFTRP
jgi:CubicO group peptidase (beta-lactamase class C family)